MHGSRRGAKMEQPRLYFLLWSILAIILFSTGARLLLYQFQLPQQGSGLNFFEPIHVKSVVRTSVFTPYETDAPEAKLDVPDHVREFDRQKIPLPRYPASELLLLSVSSNNTSQRQVSQNYTFGRIFEIEFVTDIDFPNCTLCNKTDQADRRHCPSFRTPCNQHIFFDRPKGWWCATRKTLRAPQLIMERLGINNLPKWLHVLDDNTWINPISELLLISNLDPDEPYFLGDDFGAFLAGGPGHLMSRGAMKKLLGPPLIPEVTYHWPNGSHTIYVNSQIDSCVARMQGGDWCYFHGDWAISECLIEVGVYPTDLGGRQHQTLFSQREDKPDQWFTIEGDLAQVLRRTHTAALHIKEAEMFDIFYNVIVPYYDALNKALEHTR